MISWDRVGVCDYVVVLSRYEIDVLCSYVDGLRNLLEHRMRSYITVVAESGVELQMAAEPTSDERIIAFLQEEQGTHQPTWVLEFGEERCLREILAAVRVMAAGLPEAGGVVALRSRRELMAWHRTIRHVLATISVVADREGRVRGQASEPTVAWLTGLSEWLATAVSENASAEPGSATYR